MYNSQKNEKPDNIKGIFTEEQRKSVRKKTVGLCADKEEDRPRRECQQGGQHKKRSAIPLLVEQEFHTSFSMESYREELDEVPYLLLFRTHFLPYFINKTPIEMETLRTLAEMSGLEGTSIEEEPNGYRLQGEIARGGASKANIASTCSTTWKARRRVTIRNIVFKTA